MHHNLYKAPDVACILDSVQFPLLLSIRQTLCQEGAFACVEHHLVSKEVCRSNLCNGFNLVVDFGEVITIV